MARLSPRRPVSLNGSWKEAGKRNRPKQRRPRQASGAAASPTPPRVASGGQGVPMPWALESPFQAEGLDKRTSDKERHVFRQGAKSGVAGLSLSNHVVATELQFLPDALK